MSFRIHNEASGREFACAADESVLDAALRQGIALPYGCHNGACRSCRGRLLAGRVSYPEGRPEALESAEAAAGWTLLCKARPLGDLRIRVEEIGTGDIVVRTLPARVVRLSPLAHDVMQVDLRLPNAERLRFLAGQYVDLLLRDGRRRAFSIASPPHRDDGLELQIRRVPGGTFSEYVFEHLREKALLRLRGPLGSFYLRWQDERPVVLVAGGTGFAPVKSIVEDALQRDFGRPIHLYCGVRARRDLYMHDLAAGWAAAHTGLRYTPVLSEPAPGDAWDGRTGLVHEAVAADYPDLSGHAIYMSGPPMMVRSGRAAFLARGADPERVHSDSFDYAYETGHDG